MLCVDETFVTTNIVDFSTCSALSRMMSWMAVGAVLLGLLLSCSGGLASACTSYRMRGIAIGSRVFDPLPDKASRSAGLDTGRASYISRDASNSSVLYMYHVILERGFGRWAVSDELGDTVKAVTYVDSWAILPSLIHTLGENFHAVNISLYCCVVDGARKPKFWQVHDGNEWHDDNSAILQCVDGDFDSSFYLDVGGKAWGYSGYFVETGDRLPQSSHAVYSMVENSVRRYIYKIGNNWILSEEIGSLNGIAFVEDMEASDPSKISSPIWYFGTGESWEPHTVNVIIGDAENNVVANLMLHRRISALPANQYFFELSNGVAMPAIGNIEWRKIILLFIKLCVCRFGDWWSS